MEIYEITDNKKQYLTLLLLADEQEDMIDRYLERGTMYVLEDGGVKAESHIHYLHNEGSSCQNYLGKNSNLHFFLQVKSILRC